MEGRNSRILVIRPDRIGDVILSTPVFEALKDQISDIHVAVLVRKPVTCLLKGLHSIDELLTYDPDGRHSGVSGWLQLISEIKKGSFNTALSLYSDRRIASALFAAKVPLRIGPWSKIHSYIFYNRGLRQHRSEVRLHEADYNLELLRILGVNVESGRYQTQIYLSESEISEARHWLENQGWSYGERLIAVHPGMGGSALNWPYENYVKLIQALVREHWKVLVTGGPGDNQLLRDIERDSGKSDGNLGKKNSMIFYGHDGQHRQFTLERLAGLFSHANLVVAPSTGPLHIAVALKKRVVTFYPPIPVQSKERWGPYPLRSARVIVLEPEKAYASDPDCMKRITVAQALKSVHIQMEHEKKDRI